MELLVPLQLLRITPTNFIVVVGRIQYKIILRNLR